MSLINALIHLFSSQPLTATDKIDDKNSLDNSNLGNFILVILENLVLATGL